MTVPDNIAYQIIALHLGHGEGDTTSEELVQELAEITERVTTHEDVFGLVLRLGALGAGAIRVAAELKGVEPEELLAAALDWFNASDDDEDD